MRSKFDEQMKKLNEEMMHMGSMIEYAIQNAMHAFLNSDKKLAEKIMNGDTDVDQEQKRIENLCYTLLIQRQPVARDLRTITAAMKMVTDMERIGDQAADISEITCNMTGNPDILNENHLNKMASETVIMLIHSIEAYIEKDMEKAQRVIDHDDVIDDLFVKVKNDLIKFISENPDEGEQAADLLMVNKYLERIGDHATNIAEWVIFSLDDKIQKSV